MTKFKLAILLIFSGLLFFATSHDVFAGTNQFHCEWVSGPMPCVIAQSPAPDCDSGSTVDDSCSKIGCADSAHCDPAKITECKNAVFSCKGKGTVSTKPVCCRTGYYDDHFGGCIGQGQPAVTGPVCNDLQVCDTSATSGSGAGACITKFKNPDGCKNGKYFDKELLGDRCCTNKDHGPTKCVDPTLPDACQADNVNTYGFSGGKCLANGTSAVFMCLTSSCKTAVGSVDISTPGGFIQKFLELALMIAGLVIILTLIMISYKVLTSGGKPEALQSAKEMAGSLVAGVLLIIFSLVLLQTIGISILALPGIEAVNPLLPPK